MKKITIILILLTFMMSIAITASYSQDAQVLVTKNVKFKSVPKTVEAFTKLRNTVAKTVEGGTAMYVLAMHIYNKDPELGVKCLIVVSDSSILNKSDKGYKGYELGGSYPGYLDLQLKPKPYIANSYFKGTKAEKSYALGKTLEVEFTRVSNNGDEGTAFVKSSGVDTARPVKLRKNDKGYWKVWDASSLYVGIKYPKVKVDDDL